LAQGESIGVTRAEGDAAAWTVADGGVKVGGARAIALALAVGRQAQWPVLPWKVPGAPWLFDQIYAFVAANRHRIPGETPWCLEHVGDCTPRLD
jgi:predicted DCC family thiol-disulfide oxidoreductase YuxK